MSTRFYYGQKDYIIQLNLLDDAFQAGPYSALPLAGGTLTGPVISSAGSVGTPSVGVGAANTGLYRPAANQIGMSINGINVATLTSSGLTLATALSIANGGTGATTAAAALTALAGAKLNGDGTQDFTMLSLNTGPLAGFRNVIINGDMRVAQRGVSGLGAGYGLDRWFVNMSGTAGVVSQFGPAVNMPGNGQSYVLTFTGATGNTDSNIEQRIEAANSRHLAGKTVAVSYWVYQSTGSAKTANTQLAYANALDNFGAVTIIANNTTGSIPNATWTKITTTFAIPSAAVNGIRLTLMNGIGPIVAGQNYALGDVQLEIGSIATPFERIPFSVQLAMCQRYYCKTFPYSTAPANNAGTAGALFIGGNGTNAYHTVRWDFPATMRAAPTFTYYNPVGGAAGTWRDVASNTDSTASVIGAGGDKSVHVALNNGSTFTPASTTAWYVQVAASAEL